MLGCTSGSSLSKNFDLPELVIKVPKWGYIYWLFNRRNCSVKPCSIEIILFLFPCPSSIFQWKKRRNYRLFNLFLTKSEEPINIVRGENDKEQFNRLNFQDPSPFPIGIDANLIIWDLAILKLRKDRFRPSPELQAVDSKYLNISFRVLRRASCTCLSLVRLRGGWWWNQR